MQKRFSVMSMTNGEARYLAVVFLLLTGALISGLLVADSTASHPFVRTYSSWTGDALVRVLGGENIGPSDLAPVAWDGSAPLTLHALPLEKGTGVELKLRTSRTPVRLRVLLDGESVSAFEVGPSWAHHRIWLPHQGSTLQLEQVAAAPVRIHIARIKVTNVAGFVEGLVNAWLVPRGIPVARATALTRSLLVALVLLSTLLLIFASRRGPAHKRAASFTFGSGTLGVAAGLAGARLLAEACGFQLILTPGTVVLLLLLPGGWAGALSLIRLMRMLRGRKALASLETLAVLLGVVVLVCWTVGLFVLVAGRYDGDIRGAARFGWKFPLPPAVADVQEHTRVGYDGQFYAILASDPFLRHPETIRGLDNPAYRATRILVPLLGWASVGGSARLAPFAYVLWCWVLGLAGPLVVWIWLGTARRGPLWFLALSVNAGLVVSVLRATPDAAALTILLLALLLAERRARPAAGATAGAFAVLARETSVLAVPGLLWQDLALPPPVATGVARCSCAPRRSLVVAALRGGGDAPGRRFCVGQLRDSSRLVAGESASTSCGWLGPRKGRVVGPGVGAAAPGCRWFVPVAEGTCHAGAGELPLLCCVSVLAEHQGLF